MIRSSLPPQGLPAGLPVAANLGNAKLFTDSYEPEITASRVYVSENMRKNTTLDSPVVRGCIMRINFDFDFIKNRIGGARHRL
jgi:hypothetical protein